MKERVLLEHFEEGTFTCPCGEMFHMYFNGGELDDKACRCGRRYQTRSRGSDLWVIEP